MVLCLCFTAQCMVLCLCFTAQCMVLCLCFTAQCMVLCLSVCFMFLYDSRSLDAETRASLVKERYSF